MKTSIFDRIFQLSHALDSAELIASRKTYVDTVDLLDERHDVAADLLKETMLRNLLDVYQCVLLADELGVLTDDKIVEDARIIGGRLLRLEVMVTSLAELPHENVVYPESSSVERTGFLADPGLPPIKH